MIHEMQPIILEIKETLKNKKPDRVCSPIAGRHADPRNISFWQGNTCLEQGERYQHNLITKTVKISVQLENEINLKIVPPSKSFL